MLVDLIVQVPTHLRAAGAGSGAYLLVTRHLYEWIADDLGVVVVETDA